MKKCLSVLPNFTVLADCTEYYKNQLQGILGCFCETESLAEHVDQYKITPESFWLGLNLIQETDFDFLQLLKECAKEEIPENVLKELEGFKERYGVVTLVGDDCLLVNDSDLLAEIQNSSSLDSFIYDVQGQALFFKDVPVSKLQEMFQYEFNHPIKYHNSKIKTFVIWDGYNRYAVKSPNAVEALRGLYNKHQYINEEELKQLLKHKKNEVSDEDVNQYLNLLVSNPEKSVCRLEIKEVPFKANYKSIIF